VNFLGLGLDLADGRRPSAPVVAPKSVAYGVAALLALLRRGRVKDVAGYARHAVPRAVADPGLAAALAGRAARRAVGRAGR
jgi:hypothetical protein